MSVAVIIGGTSAGRKVSSASSSFTLPSGALSPLPHPTKRACIYISGPSGVGKSTAAEKWALTYQAKYPKRDVFLISQIEDDKDYANLDKLHRLPYRGASAVDFGEFPMEWFRDALIIFDDTDTISDPEQKANVQTFKERVLETGRHTNTSVIITSHIFSNYRDTRRILNECNQYILFPKALWSDPLKASLGKYTGLNKKQVEAIRSGGGSSRWCLINTNFPQYVLYENRFVSL